MTGNTWEFKENKIFIISNKRQLPATTEQTDRDSAINNYPMGMALSSQLVYKIWKNFQINVVVSWQHREVNECTERKLYENYQHRSTKSRATNHLWTSQQLTQNWLRKQYTNSQPTSIHSITALDASSSHNWHRSLLSHRSAEVWFWTGNTNERQV